ncbi:MAG: RIP metalloprotease RseP, partial [Traorella sp.]
MTFITNILIFIIILSIIIIIHELGHLIAAKLFHVYCNEFSIGMGPVIYQRKKEGQETAFSIRALPLGGFVSMAGEEGTDIENVPFERTINGISTWKQIVVMAAGAFMNVVLAFVVFIGIVMYQGSVSVPSDPIIGEINKNSPAEVVGMQTNDQIVKMVLPDGSIIEPETFDDLINGMANYEGGSVIYTILRDGQTIDFKVEPRYDEESGRYLVGFSSIAKYKDIKWYEAFYYGAEMLVEMSGQILVGFGKLITGSGLKDVSGPVGIYQATSEVASFGLVSLVLWLGLLSLNIGIFNLIPLPILDGGRIVIALVEKVIGHRLSEKTLTWVMMFGVVLIVFLMLFSMLYKNASRLL